MGKKRTGGWQAALTSAPAEAMKQRRELAGASVHITIQKSPGVNGNKVKDRGICDQDSERRLTQGSSKGARGNGIHMSGRTVNALLRRREAGTVTQETSRRGRAQTC